MIGELISNKRVYSDIPEDEIPEAIAELMLETFNDDEVETEEVGVGVAVGVAVGNKLAG